MIASSTKNKFVVLLALLMAVASTPAQGTNARTASGTVVDEKSEAVAGATVTARWAGGSQNATTDGRGNFAIHIADETVTLSVTALSEVA